MMTDLAHTYAAGLRRATQLLGIEARMTAFPNPLLYPPSYGSFSASLRPQRALLDLSTVASVSAKSRPLPYV